MKPARGSRLEAGSNATSRSRRGQSLVEYLVVTAAVIAAIVALQGAMQNAARRVMNGALDAVPAVGR